MSLKVVEEDYSNLEEETELNTEQIEQAKQLSLHRQNAKDEFFAELIFDKLNSKIKKAYLSAYSCTDNDLKVYIYESIKNITSTMSNQYGYDNDSQILKNKFRTLKNNHTNQRKSWVKMALDYLKSNDSVVQKYRQSHYCDLDESEFIDIFKKNINDWKSSKKRMIDYPLFKYLTNAKSIGSAFKYDIGIPICDILLQSNYIEGTPIYSQPKLLLGTFSPESKKIPKYEIMDNGSQLDDLVISETTFENEQLEVKQQMSLFNGVDMYKGMDDIDVDVTKKIISNSNGDIPKETQKLIRHIVKKNIVMFKPFDRHDLDIIAYTLNHATSDFYLSRKITIVEIDLLKYLGKDPSQTKPRIWLRNRFKKIRGKQIVIAEKTVGSKMRYVDFAIFDKIYMENDNKLNTIVVHVASELYNSILKEDTINVFKNEFLSIKNSKYPEAVLLIYNLQLLRFSSYQLGRDTIQISTAFFVNLLKIESKNKVTVHSVIQECLNQFIENKVIIQSFEYNTSQRSWDLNFIKLTNRDLKLLVNSRKNYSLTAGTFSNLLELE